MKALTMWITASVVLGTWFVNCAALSKHHGGDHSTPLSRLLTLTDGSSEVRVECYLHTGHFAPQGWYEPARKTLQLAKPYHKGTR